MSVNTALSERFALIAKMTDLLGEDAFRALAYAKASRLIGDLAVDLEPVARAADAKKQLTALDGIGPKIADKIIEFVATGKIAELDELHGEIPPGLLAIMEIPGLGPKTVAVLWKQGGVESVADLKRIVADGSILSLPRMGEKAVAKIKESIAITEQAADGPKRLRLGLAVPIAERIVQRLEKVNGVKHVAFGGSARRGKETVGDIDILVSTTTHSSAAAASAAFLAMPEVRHVLAAGDSKSSVRFALKHDMGRWESDQPDGAAEEGTIQVDLRVIDEGAWGSALMYFTGSKDHNVKLRERASKMDMTLNEYGLFPEPHSEPTGASPRSSSSEPRGVSPRNELPPQKRGVMPIASKTEADVYAALGLAWIPPEMREDRGELAAFELSHQQHPERKRGAKSPAGKGAASPASPSAPPTPISLSDIKSELHAHTTASDGSMSIEELARAAKQRGFHTIAVTDHSKSSAIAGGISPERLAEHIKAIHAARKKVDGISILAGSEVDILADGSLDYDDDLLATLDVVVASPHASLRQEPAVATERLLKAIRHPLVHILGHPTGRLLDKRRGLSPDMSQIIAAAKQHNVALEINAHWMRLDLRDTHVRAAVEAGALIAIDCDVHEKEDFDNLRYGIATARRGWLAAEGCINAWDAKKLHDWLGQKRNRR